MGLLTLSCEIPAARELPADSAPMGALSIANDPLRGSGDLLRAVHCAALSCRATVAAVPRAIPANPGVAAVIERFNARGQMGLTAGEIAAVAHAIVDAAGRNGLDPALVLAVIHVESRFDAFAVSKVGALGLMQIVPSTGRELAKRIGVEWHGPQTLFDPVANVRLGVAYLKQLRDRYGDTRMALAAYNWGPGRIDQRLRKGSPMPTVYPALVLEAVSEQSQRPS
jgi:soluble lytic murein transglycosylase-like protein